MWICTLVKVKMFWISAVVDVVYDVSWDIYMCAVSTDGRTGYCQA